MNIVAYWVAAPIAKALGWTLIHFVWEAVLVAALLAAGLALCGSASARLRYGLACLALVMMPVAFGVTLVRLWPSQAGAIVVPAPRHGPARPENTRNPRHRRRSRGALRSADPSQCAVLGAIHEVHPGGSRGGSLVPVRMEFYIRFRRKMREILTFFGVVAQARLL